MYPLLKTVDPDQLASDIDNHDEYILKINWQEIHKMLVKIANREDPDQGLRHMSGPFGSQLVFKILEQLLFCICIYFSIF